MEKEAATGPKPRSHVFGYLDETGLLHTPPTDRFFGMGLVILPNPRNLHRGIIALRNSLHYYDEMKFSSVSNNNLPVYKALVNLIFSTHGIRFNCDIVDKTTRSTSNHIRSYNGYAGYLIAHSIDQVDSKSSEYITVLADDVSTNSINDQFEHMVRDRIKRVTRRNALFGICRLESHAVTELQVCDVLLGAVAYGFKMSVGSVSTKSAKAKLVRHIQQKLNTLTLAQSADLRLRNSIVFKITKK